MRKRIKVLRLSHSATLSAYRDRDRMLSEHDELELELLYPETWPHLGGEGEPTTKEPLFKCHTVGTIGTGSVPLFAFDPFALSRILQSFQPDIVDIHEEPYSVSCIESLLLTKRLSPQSACVFYSAQNVNKKYPFPFSWGEQYVYQNSEAAYPCSTSVLEVLQDKGFKKTCPVIPLGVNPTDFSPGGEHLDLPCDDDHYVFGFTGRIESCKGLQYLFHAIKHLADCDTGVPFRLVIAGGGKQEHEFRALSHQLGIDQYLVWLGSIPAQRMPAFYRICDAVVVPSITTATWREQFGRVPVEAMACGTPVIASDSGSLPEVVEDEGLVVPEQNNVELAAAMKRLLHDKELNMKLRASGRERVLQHYTWKTVAQSMVELYHDALAAKRNDAFGARSGAGSVPNESDKAELLSSGK